MSDPPVSNESSSPAPASGAGEAAAARRGATPLPDPFPIRPLAGPFDVAFPDPDRGIPALPGSKSITNRALLLAALAEGGSTLSNALFADDTRVMMAALRALGFALEIDEHGGRVTVHGRGGRIPAERAELFLGNAGTAMRFLTAACCLGRGEYVLRGAPRMHERPIGQLVDALRELGAKIEYLGEEGYPPLRIRGGGLTGGRHEIGPTASSQFVSAILQVAPYMDKGLRLNFTEPIVSEPYVSMTVVLMQTAFGASVRDESDDTGWGKTRRWIEVARSPYRGFDLAVEPDASNASYFLAAAAIVPAAVCTVGGLGLMSIQGDSFFANILSNVGAHAEKEPWRVTVRGADKLIGTMGSLNAMPDMAQTLAVVALFAEGQTVIRNIGNLRVKETDRLAALKAELSKLGARVRIEGDDLRIEPPEANVLRHPEHNEYGYPGGTVISEKHPVRIATYDDHRMAMSFAVAGLRQGGVRIEDPSCVNKTFPGFWSYLERLRGCVAPRSQSGAGGARG